MRWLFLGDARFIGVAMVEALLAQGHEVAMVGSGKYPAPPMGVAWHALPRSEVARIQVLVAKVRPHVVVDTAAMTCEQAGQGAMATMGGAATLLLLSSHDVYAQFGRVLGHPCSKIEERITEASPLTVPYPYRGIGQHAGGVDYDKKLVEATYQAHADQYERLCCLRLPATYGLRDTKHRFSFLVNAIDEGRTALPVQDGAPWRWTHGYVNDVVDAALAAATKAPKGYSVFNLGELETPTMGQRAVALGEAMGVSLLLEEVPTLPRGFETMGALAPNVVVDCSKAERSLGLSQTPLKEALAAQVEWVRRCR